MKNQLRVSDSKHILQFVTKLSSVIICATLLVGMMNACSDTHKSSLADYSESELNDLAYELYSGGEQYAKNAAYMSVSGVCPTTFSVATMDNDVELRIYLQKTQTEYCRIDYRLESDMPIFYIIKGLRDTLNKALEMVITERTYTNTDMDYLLYQKVYNASLDENGNPVADWSGEIKEEQRKVPSYNSTSDGEFRLVDHTVTRDTIKSSTVTLNEETGEYTVHLILDLDNPDTTADTIGKIRKGSADENAAYTKITFDFKVNAEGAFTKMRIYEEWAAKAAGVIDFKSTFDYDFEFSYSEADCQLMWRP